MVISSSTQPMPISLRRDREIHSRLANMSLSHTSNSTLRCLTREIRPRPSSHSRELSPMVKRSTRDHQARLMAETLASYQVSASKRSDSHSL